MTHGRGTALESADELRPGASREHEGGALGVLGVTDGDDTGEAVADLDLPANVINHLGEGTPVTVSLTRTDGGRTRLEVSDPDAYAWLIQRRPGPDDETGRGLLLLDAVTLCWGAEQGAGGKTVWCELP
jgi:hypothetical protein